MEKQGVFNWYLPTDIRDGKWVTLQARVTPDEKDDIKRCCLWLGLNYSVITRIIWKRIV